MAAQRKKQNLDLVREDGVAYAMDPADRVEPPTANSGGRPRLYEGPTTRLNLLLPEDTVKLIRHIAVEERLSPSQVVERWARRADLDRSVAQGLMDFAAGRVVEHEEVVKRLSQWD